VQLETWAETVVTLKLSWDARLDERKAKLQDMVVSANALLAHVDEQVQAGSLTRDEATHAQTIVALTGSLVMEIVAEGVATEDQAAFLRQLGVNTSQGYLYGRPMPPEQFLEFARHEVASPSPG
jgi:EAL domain-containing protein (putative c-di-GMP-specific phosphodiesterase class I)